MGTAIDFEIDGKIWNSINHSKHCKISRQSSRIRLRKYSQGLISKEDLFYIGQKQTKPLKKHKVKGEWISYRDVMKRCKISKTAACQRLVRFANGHITAEDVLYEGNLTPGGSYKGCGTDEYKSLQDKHTRDSILNDIPSPTKFDRLMADKSIRKTSRQHILTVG